ncbi:MAG: topoisomerase DNA-binding C4 zinc finger domain-containing protein [Candidatus Diapherotrites archaeon]|uniref:Topoisomerase DNA-binding C4 zinc finger domain-containing protein n=1 Tax=Candidatus Iainarchaeum sp. TaxID=3101447 RepID=A0A8T4L4W2_9ARCH|nr:topoisomerase DNA-binding C4 zinc finger domain-containing protein [Candidatus Diapherotrites archaeon]
MKCVICGSFATNYNEAEQPTCSRHTKEKAKAPKCPVCKHETVLRTGKWGSFWGCRMYPNCVGTIKI